MDKSLLNQQTLFFIFVIYCFKLTTASAFQFTIPTTLEVENAYTVKPVIGAEVLVQQKGSDGKYYSYGVYYTDSLGLVNLSLNEEKTYTITTKKKSYYTQIAVLSTDNISRIDKNKFGLSMRPKRCYRLRGKVEKLTPSVGDNYLILKNLKSNKSEKITINKEGYYFACGSYGGRYLIIPHIDGVQYQIDTLELPEETFRNKKNPFLELNIVPQKVPLPPVVEVPNVKYKKGDSLILEKIVFEGKTEALNELGKKELDLLSQDLLDNPKLTIKLRIHTDARKSERYNWLLARKRAEYIENFLIKKGIELTQFTIVPIGEAEIINRCRNGKPCSSKDHSVNNRVEMRVLVGDRHSMN